MTVTKYFNESLMKGLAVLSAIADSDTPIGVTEVAARTSLDYATTYRLVTTLSELGYVERDNQTKRYCASVAAMRLGNSYLRNSALHNAALPIMKDLLQRTGESTNLSMCVDDEMVLVATCESEQLLGTRHSRIGRYPVHCTSSGKVILAGMEPREFAEFMKRMTLARYTKNTIQDRTEFAREIDNVRRRGWAVNNEEFVLGLISVCVPIFDRSGQTLAALDISVPAARVGLREMKESITPQLIKAGARISTVLGWKPDSLSAPRQGARR